MRVTGGGLGGILLLAHGCAILENALLKVALIFVIALSGSLAHAADSACMTAAKDKKLSGAARNSFVKKCESEAKAKCETAASEKKLSGAAKTSSVNKCVRETGPAS